MAAEAAGIYLDYSKNRTTDETLKLLLQLAQESGLREHIDAMFQGEQDQCLGEPRGGSTSHSAHRGVVRSCMTAKMSCPRSMPF